MSLPMRLYNSPDIFQEKMNNLFNDLEYIRTNIDDPSMISNKSVEELIKKLVKLLNCHETKLSHNYKI